MCSSDKIGVILFSELTIHSIVLAYNLESTLDVKVELLPVYDLVDNLSHDLINKSDLFIIDCLAVNKSIHFVIDNDSDEVVLSKKILINYSPSIDIHKFSNLKNIYGIFDANVDVEYFFKKISSIIKREMS